MPHPFFAFDRVSRDFSRKQGFWGASHTVHAVREVSLTLSKGETLGLVGESGCGKSTLARMAVRLLPPSGGDILLEGKSIVRPSPEDNKGFAERLQMVFQDPYSSLNPRLTVGNSVGEALTCAGIRKKERSGRVAEILELVGLSPDHAGRYPHEFSGGQRQRLAIARALITRPDMVICDEPVSSLDASVQAQVLGLLKDMQDRFSLTYLFISHDIAVISHMSDRVAVMYQGCIVEAASAADFFAAPLHPYSRLLLDAVPEQGFSTPDGAARAEAHFAPQGACAFLPRCPEPLPQCAAMLPELSAIEDGSGKHLVCCHKWANHGES